MFEKMLWDFGVYLFEIECFLGILLLIGQVKVQIEE
jgi:hypothetical protein